MKLPSSIDGVKKFAGFKKTHLGSNKLKLQLVRGHWFVI